MRQYTSAKYIEVLVIWQTSKQTQMSLSPIIYKYVFQRICIWRDKKFDGFSEKSMLILFEQDTYTKIDLFSLLKYIQSSYLNLVTD